MDPLKFEHDLLKNALELLTEAKVLKDAGHDKRATFLLITSVEELIKFYRTLKGPKGGLKDHKDKLKLFTDIATHTISHLEADIEKLISAKKFPKDRVAQIRKTLAVMRTSGAKLKQLSWVRTRLLYVDKPKGDHITDAEIKAFIAIVWVFVPLYHQLLHDYEVKFSTIISKVQK